MENEFHHCGACGDQLPLSVRRLLTSAGTSSPAMRLRNNAVRASSNVVTGTRYASDTYFEAALLIALFGFVGSFALAKFLLRGEVIE